jgi:hypothetical protein
MQHLPWMRHGWERKTALHPPATTAIMPETVCIPETLMTLSCLEPDEDHGARGYLGSLIKCH